MALHHFTQGPGIQSLTCVLLEFPSRPRANVYKQFGRESSFSDIYCVQFCKLCVLTTLVDSGQHRYLCECLTLARHIDFLLRTHPNQMCEAGAGFTHYFTSQLAFCEKGLRRTPLDTAVDIRFKGFMLTGYRGIDLCHRNISLYFRWTILAASSQ